MENSNLLKVSHIFVPKVEGLKRQENRLPHLSASAYQQKRNECIAGQAAGKMPAASLKTTPSPAPERLVAKVNQVPAQLLAYSSLPSQSISIQQASKYRHEQLLKAGYQTQYQAKSKAGALTFKQASQAHLSNSQSKVRDKAGILHLRPVNLAQDPRFQGHVLQDWKANSATKPGSDRNASVMTGSQRSRP